MVIPTDQCGVECNDCGLTSGSADIHGVRCDSCGKFASRTSDYCARHGVNVRQLSGHDSCPKCRQERDIEARQQERMARRSDPNMHPSVDAPANAIDHSRSPSDFI